MFYQHQLRFGLILALSVVLSQASPLVAEESVRFYPIWKNMNIKQKQQFISGYIYGSDDAKRIIDIAIKFIRDNPEQAVSGLERIKEVYDLTGMDNRKLAAQIDEYYSDPEHAGEALSMAVSSARNQSLSR